MAILGTYIDKTTVSRAGDDLKGVTLATLAHAVGTSPELVLPILRSVQEVGHQPAVQVLGLGGNASIATIGYAVGSTASCPTVEFDVFAGFLHSTIR